MRFFNRHTKNIIEESFPNPTQPNLQSYYTYPGMISRSSYDNGFAPISYIVDELIKQNIRLVDPSDPEKTVQHPFWNVFCRPNNRLGYIQFVDLLVSGFLSLPELSLLVWSNNKQTIKPGCPIKGWTLENIIGFTILPNETKTVDSLGRPIWETRFDNQQYKFTEQDVITLKYSVLPDDGLTGVSPGSASSQEAAILDRVNQQQRALFDNGATPSLIVTIHARSHDEYQAIKTSYEKHNRGASKQGGIVYQSIIDNPMLASAGQPKIEITPVGMTNNNLMLKDLVEYTERHVTSNYGISPINFGDATTTSYQNQELADKKAIGRVQSIAVRLFSSLENELERLTGYELPFRFGWDNPDITLTDQKHVEMQTKTEQVRAYIGLIQSGATPKQAQVMLELPEEWAQAEIDLPEKLLEPPQLNFRPLELSSGCTCEQHNELPSHGQTTKAEQRLVSLLKTYTRELYDNKTINAVNSQTERQIIAELTAVMNEGAESVDLLSDSELQQVLADFGRLSQKAILELEKRATLVTQNYTDFVIEKIAGLSDDDPAKKKFIDFYKQYAQQRTHMIAGQEVKIAYQNGELDMASNVNNWLKQNQPLSYITKTWRTTSGKPCKFCSAMEGVQAGIQDSFVPGGLIESNDTTLYLDQTYSDGSIPDAHTNCRCKFEFKLVSKKG